MTQKSYTSGGFSTSIFLYVNDVNFKKMTSITFYKYIYSKFFFEKLLKKKLSNGSLLSFFSSYGKIDYSSKQSFNLVLFDKSFFYWNNNYFIREYTDLSSVNSNFFINDYSKYVYVLIWFCVFYFMELLL